MRRGKRYATAIDLGHAQVKVATLARTPAGTVELVKATRVDVPRPVAGQNAEDLSARQTAALREALRLHGGVSGLFVSALPRHLVAARRLVLPSVHRDEIADMVPIEAERQMPFGPGEAEISFQVIDQVGDAESHLMLVGAAERELVAHMALLEGAGQEPDVIDVSSFGTGSAYLSTVAENETVAVVNLGRQVTEISILRAGRVVESRSSFFGEQKLLAAAAPVGPSAPAGDRLQLDAPTPSPTGLAEWAEQLARELRRGFTAFQHESYGSPIHRVIFCGGLAHNAEAISHLSAALALPARVEPPPPSLFALADPAKAPGPEFATALGLALRGLYYQPGCINLIPRKVVAEHVRVHRKRFLTNAACLALALLFLAAAAVYVKYVRLDARRAELEQQLAEWGSEIKFIQESEKYFRDLNEALDKDHPAVDVIFDILRRVPRPSTVTSIDFKKRDVVVVKGQVHSLEDASEIVKKLKESPHFRREGVVPGPSQNRSGPAIHLPIWEYEVRCELASAVKKDQRRRPGRTAALPTSTTGRGDRG